MPFLHWFKRKPDHSAAKAEPAPVQKSAPEQVPPPETLRTDSEQESKPEPPSNQPRFAEVPLPEKPEIAPPEGAVRIQEPELPDSTAGVTSEDVLAAAAEKEIKLRLQSILSVFPPELNSPSIQSLNETEAEIALPLDLIQSQLANGRVVVPAEIFSRALTSSLKTHFEAIDPAAEIPIPLQEIFPRLPTESIKLREDQEMDRPEETIPTPFSAQAEEDAKRFGQAEATPIAENLLKLEEQPPPVAADGDSWRLQAIFMTEEPLDLAKTIQKVAQLPGLRSCLLSTAEGIKLAGDLNNSPQEEAIAAFLPDLFQQARLKVEALQAGSLETITLCYGIHQLSIFVQGDLCLTVFHDQRPFKPGVREKVQAVMVALTALSPTEKPL